MPSLTRKPTPNRDSTTPTFTGTLPVVNQCPGFLEQRLDGGRLEVVARRGAFRARGDAPPAWQRGGGRGRAERSRARRPRAGAVSRRASRRSGGGALQRRCRRARLGERARREAAPPRARGSAAFRASSRRSSARTRPASSTTQPARAPTTRPKTRPPKSAEQRSADDATEQRKDRTAMSQLLTGLRPTRAQSLGVYRRIERRQQLRRLPTPVEIREMIAGVAERRVGARPAILEQALVRGGEPDRAGARRCTCGRSCRTCACPSRLADRARWRS